MTENYPSFLYHYTSIDVLSLILKNRTIRFRRLDLMDDPNEAMSRDLGRQGKYRMVSCWTSKSDEELLIWSLYTKDLRGVRIKLPVFPFIKSYRINQSKVGFKIAEGDFFDSYFPAEHCFNEMYNIPPIDFKTSLIEVVYTDDDDLLHPKVLRTGNRTAIVLSELGKYKRTIWKRQTEWRYAFEIFPMTREILRVRKQSDWPQRFGQLMFEAMVREQDPVLQHMDIPISPEMIQSIEITLGPRATESDRTIVETLLKEFSTNFVLLASNLGGKIV